MQENKLNMKLITVVLLMTSLYCQGSFRTEFLDVAKEIFETHKDQAEGNIFSLSPMKNLAPHSGFFQTKLKDQENQDNNENLVAVREAIQNDRSNEQQIVVQYLNGDYYNPVFSNIHKDKWYMTEFQVLDGYDEELNLGTILYPKIKTPLDDLIGEKASSIDIFQFLTIFGRMNNLVLNFQGWGNSYCDALLEGFVITKDYKLQLYDISALNSNINCPKPGLNFFQKLGQRPSRYNRGNVDSIGLSNAYNSFFYDVVKDKRKDFEAYTGSSEKTKEIMEMLFEKGLEKKYITNYNGGYYAYHDFIDDVSLYHNLRAFGMENYELLMLCPFKEPELSYEDYKEQRNENLENCLLDLYRKRWCRNEEIQKNCEFYTRMSDLYQQVKEGFEMRICGIINFISDFCNDANNADEFEEKILKTNEFKKACDRSEKDFCTSPEQNKICNQAVPICENRINIEFERPQLFQEWCNNKVCDPVSDQQFCAKNFLLVNMNRNEKGFENFCKFEEEKAVIIEEKMAVLDTIRSIVFEHTRISLKSVFEGKTSLAEEVNYGEFLSKYLAEKPEDSGYSGLLYQQTFRIDNRTKQLFIVVLMASLIYEGNEGEYPRLSILTADGISRCNFNELDNLSQIVENVKALNENTISSFHSLFFKNNISDEIRDLDLTYALPIHKALGKMAAALTAWEGRLGGKGWTLSAAAHKRIS